MITKTVSKARSNFQELLNLAGFGHERILIERNGKPIAAIIGYDDLKRLQEVEDAIDSAELRRAVEENDGFVTLESIVANRECQTQNE